MHTDELAKLIHDEVVEAARDALFSDKGMRGAIAAGLTAWRGVHEYNPNAEPFYGYHLILPLTQKDATDEW